MYHKKPLRDGYYSPKNQTKQLYSRYNIQSPQLSEAQNIPKLAVKGSGVNRRLRTYDDNNGLQREQHALRKGTKDSYENQKKQYIDFLSEIGAGNQRHFEAKSYDEQIQPNNDVNLSYNEPLSWKSYLREDILRQYEQLSRHTKSEAQEPLKSKADLRKKQQAKKLRKKDSATSEAKAQGKEIQEFSVIEQQKIDELKGKYEERIKTLEHQNSNLKEELHYLRAAILANFQKKNMEERLASSRAIG